MSNQYLANKNFIKNICYFTGAKIIANKHLILTQDDIEFIKKYEYSTKLINNKYGTKIIVSVPEHNDVNFHFITSKVNSKLVEILQNDINNDYIITKTNGIPAILAQFTKLSENQILTVEELSSNIIQCICESDIKCLTEEDVKKEHNNIKCGNNNKVKSNQNFCLITKIFFNTDIRGIRYTISNPIIGKYSESRYI